MIIIFLGFIFKQLFISYANALLFFGFFIISVYYTVSLILVIGKKAPLIVIIQYSIIILLSYVFISKYLSFKFADYPSFVLVPAFVCSSFIFFQATGFTNPKLAITTIIYALLLIPVLGLNLENPPRELIPREWHDRYNVGKGVSIITPYKFRYKETEELSVQAFEYRKSKNYYPAIIIYQNAIKLEPENPRLYFDQAECYAIINKLEIAVSKLDTAILIDSTWAGTFNNRGLLFYKLGKSNNAIKDYLKALSLDSTQLSIYANLALAYFGIKDYDKSCEAIKRLDNTNLDDRTIQRIKQIKREYCNKYSH